MVPDISPFWTIQFEPAGSGPTSGQINPSFRPRLAERPNIQLQKICLIISSQLWLLSEQSWVTLIEHENKKMICSGDLGFYQKRSLPPISVTNKRSRGTEIETMSNLRNLFCMVAFDFFINTYLQPNKTTCNVQSSMYNPTTKSFRQLFIFFDNYWLSYFDKHKQEMFI